VVTRAQVVGAFKNVADEDAGEAPFRTLRHHGWATSGTRVRTRSGGHIVGGLVIYSSLNVDAARLARLGFEDEASKVAAEASKIESSRVWADMIGLLAKGSDDDAKAAVSGATHHGVLTSLLRTLGRATERARRRHKVLETVYEITVGSVSETRPGYVVVRTIQGDDTAIPRWIASGVSRDKPGDLVALLHERLGARKAILEAVPAIDVDVPDSKSDYSPFDDTDPRNRLSAQDAAFFRGKPAPLSVLVPVTIEG
jgi:hypothetical protein